jgi:4-aminobutyrate aminotransferase-like enzyme
LLTDRESLEPAPDETRVIINKMKESKLLLSIDGPDHNVIKIKPPVVFKKEDAVLLANTLDELISQLC